jgi:predicted naringenin-chalcone synthase
MGYDEKLMEYVTKIVRGGGVAQRYSVSPTNVKAADYLAALDVKGARGALWETGAKAMAVAAARAALSAWRRGDARDVTHVVVHSCTGFAAPGLDFMLIEELKLPSSTRKLGVNFMGCFGGFTALYVAKQIVEADETGRAVVLVCCAEAATLHCSRDKSRELIVGNTLFADGAAAAVVARAGFLGAGARGGADTPVGAEAGAGVGAGPGAAPSSPPGGSGSGNVTPTSGAASSASSAAVAAAAGAKPRRDTIGVDLTTQAVGAGARGAYGGWVLGAMSSEIVPASAGAMTWRQSAEGGRYDMFLDRSIPSALAGLFANGGIGMLRRVGIPNPWSCGWAIHPGGKGILTAFEAAFAMLGIRGEGLQHSHAVLRDFGNMSSATILFVMQRVLQAENASARAHDDVFMCGFGPGLTVEFGRLRRVRPDGSVAVLSAAETAAAQAEAEAAQAAAARATAESAAAAPPKAAAAAPEQSMAHPYAAASGGGAPAAVAGLAAALSGGAAQ